jgi:hypothetical protein
LTTADNVIDHLAAVLKRARGHGSKGIRRGTSWGAGWGSNVTYWPLELSRR